VQTGAAVGGRTGRRGPGVTDGAHDHRAASRLDPSDDLAPGGPRAIARGCLCSVLANAAFRAGQADNPCVDPRCRLHASE